MTAYCDGTQFTILKMNKLMIGLNVIQYAGMNDCEKYFFLPTIDCNVQTTTTPNH